MESLIKEQKCTECGEIKSLDLFRSDDSTKNWKRSKCLDCERAYARTYYASHRNQYHAYFRKRRKESPERAKEQDRISHQRNRKQRREQSRQWRLANPDKCKASNKEWYATHREECIAEKKKWCVANPDKVTAILRKRRAKKLSVSESFSAEQEQFVRSFWDGCCAICGKARQEQRRSLAIDHWLPLSRGNALTIRNAVLMCDSCNSKKSNHYPEDVFSHTVIEKIEVKIHEQEEAWELQMRAIA